MSNETLEAREGMYLSLNDGFASPYTVREVDGVRGPTFGPFVHIVRDFNSIEAEYADEALDAANFITVEGLVYYDGVWYNDCGTWTHAHYKQCVGHDPVVTPFDPQKAK